MRTAASPPDVPSSVPPRRALARPSAVSGTNLLGHLLSHLNGLLACILALGRSGQNDTTARCDNSFGRVVLHLKRVFLGENLEWLLLFFIRNKKKQINGDISSSWIVCCWWSGRRCCRVSLVLQTDWRLVTNGLRRRGKFIATHIRISFCQPVTV